MVPCIYLMSVVISLRDQAMAFFLLFVIFNSKTVTLLCLASLCVDVRYYISSIQNENWSANRKDFFFFFSEGSNDIRFYYGLRTFVICSICNSAFVLFVRCKKSPITVILNRPRISKHIKSTIQANIVETAILSIISSNVFTFFRVPN